MELSAFGRSCSCPQEDERLRLLLLQHQWPFELHLQWTMPAHQTLVYGCFAVYISPLGPLLITSGRWSLLPRRHWCTAPRRCIVRKLGRRVAEPNRNYLPKESTVVCRLCP